MSTAQRTAPSSSRRRSFAARTSILGAAGTLLIVCVAGSASAAPGDTAGGSTTGNVEVSTSIALTGLTDSFTLGGIPGATVVGTGAVSLNVETNNLAGYGVTVGSQSETLDPADPLVNGDSIPIGALSVRETGTTPFTALGDIVTVHSQPARSAEGGDDLSNDYQVVIPFVNEDTYTATLDYIATTL